MRGGGGKGRDTGKRRCHERLRDSPLSRKYLNSQISDSASSCQNRGHRKCEIEQATRTGIALLVSGRGAAFGLVAMLERSLESRIVQRQQGAALELPHKRRNPNSADPDGQKKIKQIKTRPGLLEIGHHHPVNVHKSDDNQSRRTEWKASERDV